MKKQLFTEEEMELIELACSYSLNYGDLSLEVELNSLLEKIQLVTLAYLVDDFKLESTIRFTENDLELIGDSCRYVRKYWDYLANRDITLKVIIDKLGIVNNR